MTPKDAMEYAKIMAAWSNGVSIEIRKKNAHPNTPWVKALPHEPLSFSFREYDYRLPPPPDSPDELYICVSHPEPRTTSYAVMPHREAAMGYICDEVLVVKVTERLKGKESV